MADFHSSAGPAALAARARLLALIREFFAARTVLEVETPVLSAAGNTDPAIEQFRTSGPAPRWLRSSPEYAMKRLLAGGVGDCYELGRVFRDGEAGRMHNPEFTLLEWYRLGWDYHRLMDETAELVRLCGAAFDHDWPVQQLAYGQMLSRHAGLEPGCSDAQLREAIRGAGINMHGLEHLERDTLLDLLVSHVAQPALPAATITVVYEYPASQAALARLKPGRPEVAERFELFLGSAELANGYRELTDASEQRHRFERENRRRRQAGRTEPPIDEQLLAALQAGLPECSGVALGVDRLLMACLGAQHLDEVLAFPAGRA